MQRWKRLRSERKRVGSVVGKGAVEAEAEGGAFS